MNWLTGHADNRITPARTKFMNETLTSLDVSHLSAEMISAAQNFASLKFDIDMLGRSRPKDIPEDLHGPMNGGEYGPHFASSFFTAVIPFFPRSKESQEATVYEVPVRHALGCSWRWWPDCKSSTKDAPEIRTHILSSYGVSSTAYTWVHELGLCLPSEGKNRINFCRHHGIETLPARVYVEHYPAADRIEIFNLSVAGGRDVWAVLDNRYVQKVSHHTHALALLRAYGVKVSEVWPEDLPPVYTVLQHAPKCTNDSLFHRSVIDLQAVQQQLDKQAQKLTEGESFTRCGLLNLPIRKKFMHFFVMIVVWMVSAITWLNFREGVTGGIALATLAFCSGVLTVMMAPVIQIQQKYIGED